MTRHVTAPMTTCGQGCRRACLRLTQRPAFRNHLVCFTVLLAATLLLAHTAGCAAEQVDAVERQAVQVAVDRQVGGVPRLDLTSVTSGEGTVGEESSLYELSDFDARPDSAKRPSPSGEASDGDPLGDELELTVIGPIYPDDRPDWIDAEPLREGPVHTTVIASGPYFTRQEAARALDEEMKNATDQYVNEFLGVKNAARYLNYDVPYIRHHLLDPDQQYGCTVQYSVGPMKEEYRVLRFDESFRRQLDARWHDIVARSRLLTTGLGTGSLLLLLLVAFCYFRLDTATRGYYTRRLQLGAAMAILALVAIGVILARWIPWL